MTRLIPVLIALAACAPSDPPADDTRDLVAASQAPGPHPVGYRTAEITYRTAGSDLDRTVPVEVWYPAATEGPPATYKVAGLAEMDAPLAQDDPEPADGTFPVAAYSHGSGGLGLVGYPYAERLASHGWVVVAPDHVGNTSLDLIVGEFDPIELIGLHRPQDVSAALDALEEGTLGLPAGLGDTSSVLLVGHSFGGWTTFVSAGAALDPAVFAVEDPALLEAFEHLGDPRITAIAPQAPAIVAGFADGALADLPQPALLMSGALDRSTPDAEEAEPAWAGLDGADDLWLRMPQGAHYSFISICDDLGTDVITTFEPGAIEDGCGPGFIDTRTAIPAMSAYTLAFGELHVRGDAAWAEVLEAELHEGIDVTRR